jgi:hypothetical protein
MACQLVGYDLLTPGKDYTPLHEAIKRLGTWWHCLDSTWIVVTPLSTQEVRNQLSSFVDSNDRLAVFALSENWATLHLSQNCNEWLRNNVAR